MAQSGKTFAGSELCSKGPFRRFQHLTNIRSTKVERVLGGQMLDAKTKLCGDHTNGSNIAPTKELTLSRNLIARI